MIGATDARRLITGGRPYPFSYLTGEVAELVEELLHFRKEGIKEEFQDAAYAGQMLVSQWTGTNFPLLCCGDAVKKFLDRIETWEGVFRKRGVRFSVDYLAGGSNYRKAEKVVKAFKAAGHEVSLEEAEKLFS